MDNAELVRTLWAVLDRDEDEPWPPADERLRLDLFAEDVEIRNVSDWPVADAYRGHDGVRQWATDVWEVFAQFRNEIEELIEADDGRTVVTVQKTLGRMRHTGLETGFRWAVVWRVRDGKVVSTQGYQDRVEALAAAGISD